MTTNLPELPDISLTGPWDGPDGGLRYVKTLLRAYGEACARAERDLYAATIDSLLAVIGAPDPMQAHYDPTAPDPIDYAREMKRRLDTGEAIIAGIRNVIDSGEGDFQQIYQYVASAVAIRARTTP